MKLKQHSTAFFVETLLLILVFILIVPVLTYVFGAATRVSERSRDRTNAVSLAASAAEAVSAADSADELVALLNEADNAGSWGTGAFATYSGKLLPDPDGPYTVRVSWEPEEGSDSPLVHSRIEVFREGKSLYELSTAVYAGNPRSSIPASDS